MNSHLPKSILSRGNIFLVHADQMIFYVLLEIHVFYVVINSGLPNYVPFCAFCRFVSSAVMYLMLFCASALCSYILGRFVCLMFKNTISRRKVPSCRHYTSSKITTHFATGHWSYPHNQLFGRLPL
jgi:hypothetical protein